MTNTNNIEKTENPLGSAPVASLVLKFAIPSVLSLLISSIYNITDQIFLGTIVGIHGNAATSVSFPTVILTAAFAQLVAIGTCAGFNINQGKGDFKKAKEYVLCGLSMLLTLAFSIAILVYFFKKPILLICGATDTVMPYALSYLSITALGIPFNMFATASSSLIRADGSPKYAMVCVVSGALLNIALDALFMIPLGMGVQGAATATLLSQILSSLLCLNYYRKFKAFDINIKELHIRKDLAIHISKLGLANFSNQIVMMIVNILLNNSLTYYGAASIYGSDIPLAISGIAAKINSIVISFNVGISHGCQPIWSYNLGAGNYSRIKETFYKATAMGCSIGVIGLCIFQIFPEQIIGFFGDGGDLYYQFGALYLRIYMMMIFLHIVQPMIINYFTSIGHVRSAMILSLSRQGIFLIPLLIIFPKFFGIMGVLYAAPVADFVAAMFAISFIIRNFRTLGKETEKIN